MKIGFVTNQLTLLAQTFGRFQGAVLCAFLLTIYALFTPSFFINLASGGFVGPYWDFSLGSPEQQKIWQIAVGGFFWFTVLAIVAESHRWQLYKHAGIALPIYGGFCLWLWLNGDSVKISGNLLLLACALSMNFAPWLLRKGDNHAFWQFSHRLLFNFFIRFSLVLAVIILVTILSFGNLISLPHQFNLSYWIIRSSLIFFLCFYLPVSFLAAIPAKYNYPVSNTETLECPQSFWGNQQKLLQLLRIFLALVALLGFVYALVSIFETFISVLIIGMFVHLAVYPYRNTSRFYDGFYGFILIALGFLINALNTEIAKHGLTENSYLKCLIALWLGIVAVLFYVRNKDFKLQYVPQTLALLLILAVAGPWGITQAPAESQFNRLAAMLQTKGLLKDGKYYPPEGIEESEYEREFRPIITQIYRSMEYDINLKDKIRPWFFDPKALDSAYYCTYPEPCEKHHIHLDLVINMDLLSKTEKNYLTGHSDTSAVTPQPAHETHYYVSYGETGVEIPPEFIGKYHVVLNFDSYALTNDIDHFVNVPGDNKTQPLQRIHLKNTTPGQIQIAFGATQTLTGEEVVKFDDLLYVQSYVTQDVLMAKPRSLEIDFNNILAKLETQYPQSFAQPKPNKFDDPYFKNVIIPIVEKSIKPMIFCVKGQNVSGRFIVGSIEYKLDAQTQKKIITGFSGYLYLNLTP